MSHPLEDESLVTVFFAGLMYFRQDEEEHIFEIGILRGAPDHTFKIFGPDGKGADIPAETTELVLEVIDKKSGNTRRDATPHQAGPEFNRRDSRGDPTDYRLIVDFDELYPPISPGDPPDYEVFDDALSPTIYAYAGEAFTLCRTEFLTSKKGDDPPTDFGYMADTIGLNISLEPNEVLVLRDRDAEDPILRVEYMPRTTQYIVVANLPPREMRDHPHDGPTHFQNYYLLVPKPFGERYDFAFKFDGPHTGCPLPEQVKRFFETTVDTPPPYFCGIASGSQGGG